MAGRMLAPMVNSKSANIFKRILESWNSGPKTGKDSQKSGGGKYQGSPFTMSALTTISHYVGFTFLP